MKRRLNILCLVVMLVLSYSVLEQGYYIFLGAKMGAQTGLELGKKGSDIAAYKELMNLKVVNLIPSSMESFDFFRDSVYNEKSRSYVPAAYSSLMVSVDSHDSVGKVVAKYLLIYLHLGFSLWAVVLFIRLIILKVRGGIMTLMTLMKQKEPKEPKRRIALIMNVLFYFCGLCIGGGIVRNLTLCYELGKDDTANFIWHILPESVTMLVMTICGLCIFLILRNVKKEEVFVYQNSSLIQTIGVLIALNGLFQVTLSWVTPEGVPTDTSYRIFVLLGVFIIFMGYLFKMGVRMREEQELTI